jgi:hypothetical protein
MNLSQKRQSLRRSVKELAKIIFDDGRPIQSCVIVDISEGGARLIVERGASLPESFLLFRKSDKSLREAVVMRRELKSVGVRLQPAIDLDSTRAKALSQLKDLSPIFSR